MLGKEAAMTNTILLDPSGRRLENIFYPKDLDHLRSLGTIIWDKNEQMPEAEIEAVRKDIDIIITGSWRYGDVSAFPRLRAILEVSGGFPSPSALDYDHCFSHGIRVLSCAPAFAPAVAEMGLTLALASARQVVSNHEAFRNGKANWSHTDPGDTFTMYNKPVGFIGFGGLARSLKPLIAPFRCPIQVYDPWLTDSYLRTQGVEPADLVTVLSKSRFVFVLAVPSAANEGFLTRELLEHVRPDAVFVLLSRSHVVDFDAFTDMVCAGRFRAAVDVFPEEPLPMDHPIRRAPNVILSSHRAGAIDEALRNIGCLVTRDTEAICRGLVPHEMQCAQPEFIQMRG
jgi:phosphoglycerate dehydrogenase-like enzyme